MKLPWPLLAALFACPSAGAELSTPPKIVTAFVLSAPDFASNMRPETRAALEAELAQHLADLLRPHFGFVEWRTASDTTAPATAKLTVTLTAEPRDFASRIFFEFTAAVGDKPLALPGLPRPVVYEAWADQPTNNTERLKRDLRDRLREQIEQDAFRDELQKGFLSAVPLIDRVLVSAPDRRLVLPLASEALKAQLGSVLRVEFAAAPPPEGVTKGGKMRLQPDGAVLEGDLRGSVRCVIQFFDFPPLTINTTGGWDDSIATVLGPGILRSLQVYMDHYVQDLNPGTAGPLVTRPE